MISILPYLYRKLGPAAIALSLALMFAAPAPAQLRDRTPHDSDAQQAPPAKPKKRGPRAIGVLEFLPGGVTRLVPVALWIDGHYYDASIYAANPAPMAVEPGTQYQGMSYGEPTGWFTVTTPKQIMGNWVADGQWKPTGALDARLAAEAAKQPKAKPKQPVLDDDQGPPVLRRSGGSGSSSPDTAQPGSSAPSSGAPTTETTAAAAAPKPASDDADRPTLKAPPPANADSSRPTLGADASGTNSAASSADSSRPTLGPDTSATNSAPAAPGVSPDEYDPDRPTLSRGKPSPANAAPTAAARASSPGTAAKASDVAAKAVKAPGPVQPRQAYPAISDAGNYETRPMLYPMTPAEKDEKARTLLPMAVDELRNFAAKRNSPPMPKTAALTDYEVRAFDLDFSNSPTLVLTGKLPVASAKGADFAYFVTLVARLDLNGQPVKIFSSVTDSTHLDAFPRLQIIDAVDADSNGRGMLLFRQYSDTGLNYGLYRVFPYQMVKVFEGGAGV